MPTKRDQKLAVIQAAAERTKRLGELCDQVAELLGADPERIMYDSSANQVCVPAELMAQLLAKAGA